MFAKLFARITESSLMEEDIPVRYTFVLLIAIADPFGDVIGTDVAIARRLNMPLLDFVNCVNKLMEPDQDSNSKEENGRRVVMSTGERGYRIVNYLTYRNLKDETEKRDYMREYMRKRRENEKLLTSVNSRKGPLTDVTQAEAEAEAEAEKKHTSVSVKLSVADELMESWNSIQGVVGCRNMTAKRKKSLASRLASDQWEKDWPKALIKLDQSDFCKGGGGQNWRADIDWFLTPDAVNKLLEGKYDNRQAPSKNGKSEADRLMADGTYFPDTTAEWKCGRPSNSKPDDFPI